ncbi:MAG: hypothetical protein CNIPEHKO_00766 [Anaerolineales bacterium]|nr:hypothetical protein [Anaerolineales bacterium]
MSENIESHPLIIECPHCHTNVIPMADNHCPNCGENVLDMSGVDLNHVAFFVNESEEFPPCCYSCGRFTERLIRVSSDQESGLETLIFGEQPPENTSNVIVYLPECERCSESEVELIEVDYEHQMMKIMVHRGFRDRVLQYRQTPRQQVDVDFDGDL